MTTTFESSSTDIDPETPPTDSKRETGIVDPFPYNDAEPGTRLAAHPVRGVLRSSDGSSGLEGSTDCPSCDSETINGAGLFACTTCEWSGSLR